MIPAEEQVKAVQEFIERNPNFPQTTESAKLLSDRVRRLIDEHGEEAFSCTVLQLAYHQLVMSGAIRQDELAMTEDKFSKLSTSEMESYLRSQGAI